MNHLVPLLLMSAKSFGEGVQLAIRYQELLSHARVISMEDHDRHKCIRLHKIDGKLPVTEQEVEFMAAGLLGLFRMATASAFQLSEARFAHRQLGRIEEYSRALGCPTLFDQAQTELVISEENWRMPLPHHSTSLQAPFESGNCSWKATETPPGDKIATKLRQVSRRSFPGG